MCWLMLILLLLLQVKLLCILRHELWMRLRVQSISILFVGSSPCNHVGMLYGVCESFGSIC
jgi:hypothetical protein